MTKRKVESSAQREQRLAYMRRWRAENPDKQRDAMRAWRKANRDKFNAGQRRWATTEKAKAGQRRRSGLPEPLYPEPALCECCGRDPRAVARVPMSLDHDHETGRFRGWLCSNCNTGIGMLGDTAAGVERALQYLQLKSLLGAV